MILLTKLENIIGMKGNFVQIMEVLVSIMGFLYRIEGTLGSFFVWNFTPYDVF